MQFSNGWHGFPSPVRNDPPAEPEAFRRLAPPRGLTAADKLPLTPTPLPWGDGRGAMGSSGEGFCRNPNSRSTPMVGSVKPFLPPRPSPAPDGTGPSRGLSRRSSISSPSISGQGPGGRQDMGGLGKDSVFLNRMVGNEDVFARQPADGSVKVGKQLIRNARRNFRPVTP